ncbi:AAA family ATPase [Nocardia vinacea]|uniref:AAA family ATPase n=1 Tax=Nocardia vinacea TaxID=96468 RepID=UPI002E10DC3F|nr:AAA family ATPase [Nocardia vinacea]
MLIALEGAAGTGKSTLRDRILTRASDRSIAITHLGQFSWLSLPATRTLVALRAGRALVDENTATTAVLDDLILHARHNIGPATRAQHVITDRLILSSACLLAATHTRPVEHYLSTLAAASRIQPDLTVVLTTPPEICRRRLATRPTAARPGDAPDVALEQHRLYKQAANAWQHTVNRPLWRRRLLTPRDTDRVCDEILDHLHPPIPGETL